MTTLPPIVLIAIAAASAAIPAILVLMTVGAPFLRTWLKGHVKKQELQRLHDSLRGAASVVSFVAKETKGFTLDDGIAEILSLASAEVGKALVEKYGKEAVSYVLALHADERRPDIEIGEVKSAKELLEIGKREAVRVAKFVFPVDKSPVNDKSVG
jgi:hypothetical protein